MNLKKIILITTSLLFMFSFANAQRSLVGGTWETEIITFDGTHFRITKVIKVSYESDGIADLKGHTVMTCPSGYCSPSISARWQATRYYQLRKNNSNKTTIEFYNLNKQLEEEGTIAWGNGDSYIYRNTRDPKKTVYRRR